MAERLLSRDELVEVVRRKLNEEKVKLWLSPYSEDDGQKGIVPEELISRFSAQLHATPSLVAEAMETLRQHAVAKLASRRRFQETGVATLRVRLAGALPERVEREMAVETRLGASGGELREAVSRLCAVPARRIKLIAAGRVVDDADSLDSHNIKHASQLMAVCLEDSESASRSAQDLDDANRVAKTRAAAEMMSSRDPESSDSGSSAGQYYLQIADQSGKSLDLPDDERKALLLAMTLHEKGRAALKRRRHGEALLLLLEADTQFTKCRSDILNCVDNYALVCLDIVWCYLCLQNVADLPDAERRLKACDECFRRSYGTNFERLTQVKGGSGQEQALLVRLHLLQGVLSYHRGDGGGRATHYLDMAERELLLMKVDEEKLVQVMEMGYSCREARLGLRATSGDTQRAVTHIIDKRHERKERRAREREERRKRKLSHELGKTAGGEWLNVDLLENMATMGFPRHSAINALKQTDNDITAAVQVLHDNPDLLDIPDTGPMNITDEMVAKVTEMGFDVDSARAALHRFGGATERAIEELLTLGGIAPPDWLRAMQTAADATSTDIDLTSSEDAARQREMVDLIVPDIPDDDEDHLDLALDEETAFLHQYRALILSAP